MKLRAVLNILVMSAVTLLAIAGFFGLMFGATAIKVACTAGLLLTIGAALKIQQCKPVYL